MGIPNVPGRRKAMPKPFQRKSITLTDPNVKREWQEIPPALLMPGDILANEGVVRGGGIVEQLQQKDPYLFTVVVRLQCGAPEPHEVKIQQRFTAQELSRLEGEPVYAMKPVYAFTRVR